MAQKRVLYLLEVMEFDVDPDRIDVVEEVNPPGRPQEWIFYKSTRRWCRLSEMLGLVTVDEKNVSPSVREAVYRSL